MAVINQKEYLKKYLSGGRDGDKKKKRKKKKVTAAIGDRVKIIDDDIDISQLTSLKDAVDLFNTNEDAPQVVGVIDERPPHLRIDDYRKGDLWKPVGSSTSEIPYPDVEIQTNLLENKQSGTRNDYSPPRRIKNKEKRDDDHSPPRRKRKPEGNSPVTNTTSNIKVETNSSPPRRIRRNSDSSPPRKRDADSSPPRKSRRNSDASPPRRSRWDSGSRQSKQSPNNSRIKQESQTKDSSPPRRRGRTPDISPPRRGIKNNSEAKSPQQEVVKRKLLPGNSKGKYLIPAKRTGKMTKTLDGKTAGLQNAQELVKETEAFRKRENELFQNMPAEMSGANASAVVRDRKTGKIRDLQKEAEEKKEKEKREAEEKEKYSRWGRGLKQVQDYEEKLVQDLHEMSKPLARYADDEDLERYLKERELPGDPMLEFIKKKRKKQAVENNEPEKPRFQGEFMPNRFGIPPGYRWDGVDRSNGYEKKWFQIQNEKRAEQEEIYKWSTEDM